MSEMLHISGQRPYVNTIQDQFLEYENGTHAVWLLSNVSWNQICGCIEVNSRLCVSVW